MASRPRKGAGEYRPDSVKPESDMVQIPVRIERELYDRLKERAKKDERSAAGQVRIYIRHGLDKETPEP